MKVPAVRQLVKSDLGFVHKMTVTEQWNDRLEDIERMFSYEPKGCFIAEIDRERVGHVFTVNYGKLGWIGLLIVKAEYRRKGIGELLMRSAIDYLRSCGTETLKLEAVPEIADLYRKLGFVDEYDSLRFMGTSGNVHSSEHSLARPLKRDHISALAQFDSKYFGVNRKRVLARLLQEYPRLGLVSLSRSQILGYVMCRQAETGYKLGPWVCNPESPRETEGLLSRCIGELEPNAKVFIGVPAANEAAVKILQNSGFQQYSKSIRMRLGPKLEGECVRGVFAIGGPMKG